LQVERRATDQSQLHKSPYYTNYYTNALRKRLFHSCYHAMLHVRENVAVGVERNCYGSVTK